MKKYISMSDHQVTKDSNNKYRRLNNFMGKPVKNHQAVKTKVKMYEEKVF